MEFRELKTFQVVASLLSFNKAATVLHYAQSTVSAQIRSLENSIGKKLFFRSGKTISLTSAGIKLLEYAQRLVNMEKEILSAFKNINDKHGHLTIKTPQTISTYFFPNLIKEFQLIFPKISFDIDWCTSFNLANIMNSGTADLAFLITDKFSEKNLYIECLHDIDLVLAVSSKHKLLSAKAIIPKDLENETLVFAKSDCNYGKILKQLLVNESIIIKNNIEINSIDAIKKLIITGEGICYLPKMIIEDELLNGTIRTLKWKGANINAKLFMIWPKERLISEPLEAFMMMVRKAISGN